MRKLAHLYHRIVWFLEPFSRGSQVWWTDRQTDRQNHR